MEYVIEMLNITKEFPGIKANDNITVQLKKGEIHALLGQSYSGCINLTRDALKLTVKLLKQMILTMLIVIKLEWFINILN